ncbi:MAG TPA: sugar phosphate isomerase/epimerase family protein [Edaphobacter sp.]|nr:sugar phosphate isomerase/epimerase family protein [Edaphobacter sp.]
MRRRDFLGLATAAALAGTSGVMEGMVPSAEPAMGTPVRMGKPGMELGLKVSPGRDPETTIRRVHDLGFSNTFFSLDSYIGKFTPALAKQMRGLLDRYGLTLTTVEVVGPGKLVWDFMQGPSTIGVVPEATRSARIDALRQVSDFAKLLGVGQVQTHCGFIPENPSEPLYAEAVKAIQTVAKHCAGNGQDFLMETGQETPTTMSRMLRDAAQPNLGVGLDTANLIMYGKANPVDAVDIIGPHVKSIHAKDGRWPTNPDKLGEEVLIGTGLVDFHKVFTKLHHLGYSGVVTIERETSGPQQIADVRQEKLYLEKVLKQVIG